MVRYKLFTVNPIQENCYIIWDENTLDAAIIDCGAFTAGEKNEIKDFISSQGLHPRYALQTHVHFDHTMGLPFVLEEYGLSPMYHEADETVYKSAPQMMKDWFGISIPPLPEKAAFLRNGQIITIGSVAIHVIHTPGHTPGGVCLYIPSDSLLFSGDTLFRFSIGRTDFPGGSLHQITQSILQNLITLPDETTVLPGHGPKSSIGEEKINNPYIY